jgi:hypothetical protein
MTKNDEKIEDLVKRFGIPKKDIVDVMKLEKKGVQLHEMSEMTGIHEDDLVEIIDELEG